MVSVIIVIIVIAAVIFQAWRKSAGTREKSGPQDPARTAQTSYRTDGRVRKTQKKSSAASVPRRKAEPKENILTAAKENTVEVAVGNDLDAIASEQLMDNVYDVMVKGPKDTLTFSRDFVAEATDMLNRYTTLP